MKRNLLIGGMVLFFFCYEIPAQNQFWEQLSLSGQAVYQLEIDRQNNFYAVSDWGGVRILLKSSDCITWEPIFSPSPVHLFLIDTTNAAYDRLFLLKNENNYYSLFYSTDSGESWELYSDSLINIRQFAYNSEGNLYLLTPNNIQYTTNNGNTWEIINTPSDGIQNNIRLQIDIQGNIYTSSTYPYPNGGLYEGIWRSEDNGLTWTSDLTSWLHGEDFTLFATLPSGELSAGAWADPDDLLYFKKNPDQNWYVITTFNSPGNMAINKYKYIYVTKVRYVSNFIPSRYSPDYGSTWFNFDNGSFRFFNLIFDKEGYLYAASSSGIYRSVQSTFPIISRKVISFPEAAINDSSSLEISIFNSFSSQLIIDSTSINSEDFHTEFTVPIILEPGDSETVSIYFTPQTMGNHNDTLILYSNLKTESAFLAGNSPEPEFVTNPPEIHSLFFGFVLLDSTKTKSIKIINHSINFLEIDSIYTHKSQFNVSSFNYPIYIVSDSIDLDISFTPDSSIYYADTVFIINNVQTSPYLITLMGAGAPLVNTKNENEESFGFELSDNFPNPFNPSTKIKYQIPELSKVKLTVFNLLGVKIATLVNEEKSAGVYEVVFDGTGLSSGVYFYRIETEKYSDTKKLLLLK